MFDNLISICRRNFDLGVLVLEQQSLCRSLIVFPVSGLYN
jgi:hypothetical protein